jgi:predicted ATP-binding protein involved in virulence
MPPALYQWDMKFKKVGENECDIDFDSFSSGEKQMLNSIGAVIYHLQNLNTTAVTHYSNVNIVLEEIELYYHPECQRNYINMLLHLLSGIKLNNLGNINIVFVTHSPFILSDIPKCNVLFLRDGMDQHLMQENTFGANIHAMLKNGFFLPNLTMGEFAYQKINGLFEKMNTGDFSKDEMDDIYQEILLVGEPFLRGQLLSMFNNYRGHHA